MGGGNSGGLICLLVGGGKSIRKKVGKNGGKIGGKNIIYTRL